MSAVFRHELRCSFNSLSTWLFCAFLLAFVGIGSMLYNLMSAVANFEYVLEFVELGLVVMIPILTMRTLAEERKQKTDQLLLSLPLQSWQIVLGKYLALVVVFLVPMCIIAFYPLIFSFFGDVYLPCTYGSMFAFVCMSMALIAIGVFLSSLTDSIGFAAGIAIIALLLNYYSVDLAEYISSASTGAFLAFAAVIAVIALAVRFLTGSEKLAWGIFAACILLLGAAFAVAYATDSTLFDGLLPEIVKQLSLFDRFTDFVDGVFDITSIVFYFSVAAAFLFFTVQSLEKRRYN